MKRFRWLLLVGLFHYFIFALGTYVMQNNLFVSSETLAKYYYKEYFVKEYGDEIGSTILCDEEQIFSENKYEFDSVIHVTYFCQNGKASVFEFDKGFRWATSTTWQEY